MDSRFNSRTVYNVVLINSVHWHRINERIECKPLSLTIKVLTTTQLTYDLRVGSWRYARHRYSSSLPHLLYKRSFETFTNILILKALNSILKIDSSHVFKQNIEIECM